MILELLVAVAPPVTVPVKVGTLVQVYNVLDGTIPLVELAGVNVNGAPLQTEKAIGLTAARGFTKTVTVNVAPWQLPKEDREL